LIPLALPIEQKENTESSFSDYALSKSLARPAYPRSGFRKRNRRTFSSATASAFLRSGVDPCRKVLMGSAPRARPSYRNYTAKVVS
jgi:hypothetical protein